MALHVWTKNSGYSLGTFPESLAVSQQLPVVPGAAFNGVPPPSFDGTNHHPTAPLRNNYQNTINTLCHPTPHFRN